MVKKILIFGGIALDVLVTVFLFVVSIIMLATMPPSGTDMQAYYEENKGMITFFQANPTLYLLTCVLPLIILLVVNVILLALYIKKAAKRKIALNDLNEDQKAALREAILKDMESPKEEKKE